MRTIALLLSLCILSACAALRPAPAPGNRLAHVVLLWLKEPGNAGHRRQLVAGCKTLRGIDGVSAVRTGVSIPSDRSVVDDSFDVGLYIELTSEEALAGYGSHPLHQALLKDTIAPLTERYIVYDFTLDADR